MKYTRPVRKQREFKQFEEGTHEAVIKKVILTKTKTGKDMLKLVILGRNEECGLYHIPFGNDYTEKNLNYVLASIEDNGIDIPDVEFGYNQETADFLQGKDIFVEITTEEYKGEVRSKVSKVLSLDEYETNEAGIFEEETFDDWQ